jgi:hypothetical protein
MTEPLDWRQPQTFEPATSAQVRDQLQDLVARDLLGPWDGPAEQFAPRSAGPRDRYLVGMLGPRHTATEENPSDLPDLDMDAEDPDDPELPDRLAVQSLGQMWASSMGLTFSVGSDVDVVAVEVGWGSYTTEESTDEDGRTRRVWTRTPVGHPFEASVDTAGSHTYWLLGSAGDQFGVWLAAEVRHRDSRRIVRLTLVNGQSGQVAPRDSAWLFQAGISVTALDGAAAIFLPVGDVVDGKPSYAPDAEERHLQLLYREARRYAAGHNIAVHPEFRSGEQAAWRLSTTWLPTYEVPQVQATGALAGLQTSMDALAELSADPAALATALRPLATGYIEWLSTQEGRLGALPKELREAGAAAIAAARTAAGRIHAGVDLLATDEQARNAFAFANSAMALQRRNTAAGVLRADDPDLSYRDAYQQVVDQGPSSASWRPFQLAFILLNLPSLTDPGREERGELVDLLFFPTGGGKTEAYLGLTAYTFAIRRLQGVVGTGARARDGHDGVAVLMRYTLRLLTAQQFQRAAALVCATEVLRRQDEATWGTHPFTIGLWVGGTVSPNWYTDAANQVKEAREAGRYARTSVMQTLACPWCGTVLQAYRDLYADDGARHIAVQCPNAEGPDACPFSPVASGGLGLPILTVDEEIYRRLPSLLIATVDKLAQLPWNGYAGMLLGRVSRWCPRHGYRHPDLDDRTGCGESHHATASLPNVKSHAVTRLRPPDLIIQDELHLISGALGTTVGLFESAVDELCGWSLDDGRRTGPKIIASTATTKRAVEQVKGLYARGLSMFPPQVLDASDTFFSAQVAVDQQNPGRRYVGICAHGVRLKSAEIRLAEILLIASQTMFDKYGAPADPYMTLVGYFNATRELAGMRRYLDDDVMTRVRRNGRRRGLSDRLAGVVNMLTIRELTSRINSGEIASVLKALEEPFDEEHDTTSRRMAFYEELRQARAEKREPVLPEDWFHAAVDVALATSMLQVGVDVPRLGVMVVTGQPKNTAEYIQASSRVGRVASKPGLVFTIYNWTRPRDLAHFEDFENYHATFYRQVEALSVTPFSRRSLDRGTAATFIAAARHVEEPYSPNQAAYDVDLGGDTVEAVTQRMLARAERASDSRGRAYLGEKVKALSDVWNQAKGAPARLGYRAAKEKGQQVIGLIRPAGDGPWTVTTVSRSMRETESDINLLLPGTGLFAPSYGQPGFTFGPPPESETADVGDELGEAK